MAPDELDTRLRNVETELATLGQLIKDNLRRLDELTAKHELALFGEPDGKSGSRGILERIGLLEQTDAVRRWLLRAAASAALVAAGGIITKLIGF